MQCDEKGENHKPIRKSTFLWLLQEEKERVSTDRLERFRSGKTEVLVERVVSTNHFFVDSAITFGDFALFRKKSNESNKKFTFYIGQVINFEKEGKNKRERKFPFSYCILENNKKLIVKLAPCYEIVKSTRLAGRLKESSVQFFAVSDYVSSSKMGYFDIENLVIERDIMRSMKDLM